MYVNHFSKRVGTGFFSVLDEWFQLCNWCVLNTFFFEVFQMFSHFALSASLPCTFFCIVVVFLILAWSLVI